MKAALLVLLAVLLATTVVAQKPQTAKDVMLINEAGVPLDVYWVHPIDGSIHKMNDDTVMQPATNIMLNSFAGHEFEVHEVPDASGECSHTEERQCRRVIFQVTPHSDQKVFVTPAFEAIIEDSTLKAKAAAGDLITECHNQVKRSMASSSPSPEELQSSITTLLKCVEERVATNLVHSQEEVAFQASVRKDMAAKLENYTCEDAAAETTTPVYETIWDGAKDGYGRKVLVLHDRPASQIHVVEEFIDPEECYAMEQAAEPILHRATVADGSGGSKYSEHRKAMQAGIKVPWDKEADGNPIARLSRRVYDYANHVLGLGLEHYGQEDLMSIQYFGRGYNDTAPDRYTPHCDGDCTGLKHKYGTRMATMVMYCKIPKEGGHTNFRNSGVHVKPQMGNAIFFSYIDPVTKTMDTGFTEHSGCPVFEGEKKIVTQWIRYGVDTENPWDSFNTLGIKKSEEQEY